jgi:peptidoglycan/LPS O-acetylase OafA/YrhL
MLRRRRVVLTVGAAWGAAILLIAPVLLKFRTIQAGFSMRREMTEIIGYSADITSIFAASRDIVAWRSLALFRKAGEVAGARRAVSEIVKWLNHVTDNRMLSLAPLRWLGLISYGLYLIHMLAFDFVDHWIVKFFPSLYPQIPAHLGLMFLRFARFHYISALDGSGSSVAASADVAH